jgi:hypothetical protein
MVSRQSHRWPYNRKRAARNRQGTANNQIHLINSAIPLGTGEGKTMNPTPTRFKSPDGQKLAYVKWAKDWRIVHIDPEMRDRKSFDIISAAIEKAE